MSKSICMLLHGYYLPDPRVRREAETLVEAGHTVDVLALHEEGEPASEVINGVRVIRVPLMRHRSSGQGVYILEYLAFMFLASLQLIRMQLSGGYDLIQVHTPPDFLIWATLVPKLFGAKVVLDLHELMPEFYMSKYKVSADNVMIRMLKIIERRAVFYSDHTFTASSPFRMRLLSRNIPEDRVEVLLNSADSKIFEESEYRKPSNGSLVLLNHGTVQERYGIEVAINAIALLHDKIPGLFLHIYNSERVPSPYAVQMERLAEEKGLADQVKFFPPVDVSEIPEVLGKIDVGVVPVLRDAHMDLAFPSRIFEYVALGVPVIAARTQAVESLFDDDAISYFEPGNERQLADRIMELYVNPEVARSKVANAKKAYERNRWEVLKRSFVDRIDKL